MPLDPFDFETVIERRGTASAKWERYRGRDVLPLWVADMDFRSPPAVLDALRRRVDHGIFGYPVAPDALVDVVREMLERDYGWRIDPVWIVWLPGLVTGINLCCRAVGTSGDEVLSTTPIYPPFLTAPRFSDRTVTRVPMVCAADRWVMDLERIAAAVTPRTRLMLLCNPHNPAGRIFGRDELTQLARICAEHDLVICSDEIHCELLLDEGKPHIPIATLGPDVAARTITLLAPSKTYNIAGLGCSLAVISDAGLRQRFQNEARGIVPGVNVLGYEAALAAYRDGRAWREALLTTLRAHRDQVVASVAAMPGLEMAVPEATYLAWIDARGLGVASPARFFEQHGVGLSDGVDFGVPGFVRLNFGCPRGLLLEALDRMARATAARTGGEGEPPDSP